MSMVPVLRAVETRWLEHEGQPALLLRDPMGVGKTLVLTLTGARLLSLCDGQRDLAAIRRAYRVQFGEVIPESLVAHLFEQLDEACLLESPRYLEMQNGALAAYRSAPQRPLVLADGVYPGDGQACAQMLAGYGSEPSLPAEEVVGLISPHIDYRRGGPVYAQVWGRAAAAALAADLAIIFGTDHYGGISSLTLTQQNYATPWGPLPTARDVVDELARAIGPEAAFAGELRHSQEHSVDLAATWLHFVRGGEPIELVPILCGSFQPYTEGQAQAASEETFAAVIETLRAASKGRRVLVVASGDLAHVGPNFGDAQAFGSVEKARLRRGDQELLAAACAGDAEAFLAAVCAVRDQNRICGLPPIYLALRYLESVTGDLAGYDQCPADEQKASWVSVAGVVWRR